MAADRNIIRRTLKSTALYKAVLADDLSTIKKLLKENAELIFLSYMHEDKKRGLLYVLFRLEKLAVIKMLMQEYPENFKLAVQKDESLLDLALDVNKPIELLDILIQNKVDVNYDINYWYGEETPLFKAVDNNNKMAVDMLIKAGANADAHSMCMGVKLTALYVAVKNNNIEIASILINAGADVNLESHLTLCAPIIKVPPLHWAVHNDNVELAKMLIEAGAHLYPGNDFLKTAVKKNNIELVKVLIDAGAYVDFQQFDLNLTSNEMRAVLVNYPSHLAKGEEKILLETHKVSLSNKPQTLFGAQRTLASTFSIRTERSPIIEGQRTYK